MLNMFKKRKLERYKQMVRMEQLEKNVELANQRYNELSDAFKDALRYGHIVGMEYDENGEPIFVARIVEMRQNCKDYGKRKRKIGDMARGREKNHAFSRGTGYHSKLQKRHVACLPSLQKSI